MALKKKSQQGGRSSKQALGFSMVAAASLLFGFNGNLSRVLFDQRGVTPITLVEFRMLIGGLCLLVVMLIGWRQGLKWYARSWGWIIAFGLTLAMVTYTYFMAISLLPIAVALIIQFSAAAWMALGEAIWKRKLPSLPVIIALICTLCGLLLLTGVWNLSLNGLNLVGLLFGVLALLFFIAYLLLGKRIGRDVPSLPATAYGAIVAGIFWLFVQPPWSIPASTWDWQTLLLITVVGVAGMAIPFALELGALRHVDATRVGIVTTLELVAGSIIAYFWLGQQLDIAQIIGCVLVLAALIVLQYDQAPEVPSLTS
ncbi:EamA family transporter [Ktedonospora formicarum]|uniref:Peptide ABC transporter ATP-binding protein n=1 Tax=Ktedonospora formicarum TaxID=2778364 RepID=A0A8J3HZ25_9CHLR|nr:EamA family transporter [Ktedonospora formicarum]GHO42544.1 peptide ABC transporter ATP-binding protein [Ktedonospora formicarum]